MQCRVALIWFSELKYLLLVDAPGFLYNLRKKEYTLISNEYIPDRKRELSTESTG